MKLAIVKDGYHFTDPKEPSAKFLNGQTIGPNFTRNTMTTATTLSVARIVVDCVDITTDKKHTFYTNKDVICLGE